MRIGCLMMEDLVSMHAEYNQFYGPDERPGCPGWMEWEELEKLPLELRDIVMGKDGEELGSWMPLYRFVFLISWVFIKIVISVWRLWLF